MFWCGSNLYTIEKGGNLYQVNVGGTSQSGAPAATQTAINEKSSAAVAGNLTFAFMGKWVGDTATYEKDPVYKEAVKTSPEMAKAALGMLKTMVMNVTLDGMTMEIMGEKIGPIQFTVIKPPSRQDILFLDAKHIKMAEKGNEAKALFLVKQ
ncbi:MAG: hypothetical protein NTW95_07690 [Candidatus Aminicenantes bacterium]|nr:hypothetical protein [Candidatus Aminicenantes bacterium]